MNTEQKDIMPFLAAFFKTFLTPIIKEAIENNMVSIPTPLQNSSNEALPERYIDTKEAQQILGNVSSVSIWDWEKKGILQSYRIGNLKRFKLSEVLASPKAIQRTKK